MGDTFERVSSNMVEADGNELNSLILENESIMVWVRDQKISRHLHWVKNISVDSERW